jgi:hypothetical protein
MEFTNSLDIISAFATLFSPTYYPDSFLGFGNNALNVLLEYYGEPKSTNDGTWFKPIIDKEDCRLCFRSFLIFGREHSSLGFSEFVTTVVTEGHAFPSFQILGNVAQSLELSWSLTLGKIKTVFSNASFIPSKVMIFTSSLISNCSSFSSNRSSFSSKDLFSMSFIFSMSKLWNFIGNSKI